ncbi:MAG: glycosyltransferase family 4 protein [Moraxellaceae bacterium]|nr:glycosyltransferase family 4 protein [Moraxellaceae bacterium]
MKESNQNDNVVFNLMYSPFQGGLEEMFILYTDLLVNLGYKVYCIVHSDFKYSHRLSKTNVEIICMPIHGYYNLLATYKFHQLVNKYNPKFIFSHKGRNHALIKMWTIFRNFNSKYQNIKTIGVCHGCTKRLTHFDAVIAVSKYLYKPILEQNYRGKLFYLPNFIDDKITQYKYASIKNKNIITFGLIGRLAPEKGFNIALDAFSLLANNHSELDFNVLIAGEGGEQASLQKQAERLNIGHKVRFLGWIHDKEDFFNKIDIIIVPSFTESFGLIILEAFSHGKAVIASNIDGPAEIIMDNKNGLLFEVANSKSCYESIIKLIGTDGLHELLCKNAFHSMMTTYNKHNIQKNLENILQSIM